MKEIGGYIELDNYTGRALHSEAVALNCGRSALAYLLEARGIKKLYIPYFCCESLVQPCRQAGVPYEFYHVGSNLRPDFDKILAEDECLLLINYYGQISTAEMEKYKSRHGNVIADNTQAYFQMPLKGMDTMYSCRKYFGVCDGGLLYTDARLNRELAIDESFERIHYVLGRYERTAGEFFSEACANNAFFDNEGVKRMSKLTENMLRALDYDEVRKKRTENFMFLHEALNKRNGLSLIVPEGAFMYPLYIKNGGVIRKKLQAQKIFVPTLWPDVFELCKPDSTEYDLAQNILPLPIDQRYDLSDMLRIVETIDGLI